MKTLFQKIIAGKKIPTFEEWIEPERKRISKEADKAIKEAQKLPNDWTNGPWTKGSYIAQIKQRYADRSAKNLLDVEAYKKEYKRLFGGK